MPRPILSILGDGTAAPNSPPFLAARTLGRLAVDAGFRVMTGAMGGVMTAASQGARESPRYREGDTLGLVPTFDPADANPFVDIPIATGLGHARNLLVANADAVIAIGGGAGTLAEIAFAWIYKRLIIALAPTGDHALSGWSAELADRRLDPRDRGLGVPDDRIFAAETPERAIALVLERLPQYSARFKGYTPRDEPGAPG